MKDYHPLFRKRENQILLAVSARKNIIYFAAGGVVWGLLGVIFGLWGLRESVSSAGLVMSGLVMIYVAMYAFQAPTLESMRLVVIASIALFCGSVGFELYHALVHDGDFSEDMITYSFMASSAFIGFYRKTKPLGDVISKLTPELLQAAKSTCKRIFKTPEKVNVNLFLFSDGNYRMLFEDGQFIFFAKNMNASFFATPEELRELIMDPNEKKLRLVIDHPLKKVKIGMNKKQTEKLLALL